MRKYLTTVLCLCSFAYCFITLYSITTILSAGSAEAGIISLLTSCYYAGYIISQLPGGLLADYIGAKRLLLSCTLLNALSVLMYGFAGTTFLKASLRLIGGLCCGPVMSSSTKLIAEAFASPSSRTKNLGIMLASPPAGLLLSNSVTPWLLSFLTGPRLYLLLTAPGFIIVVSGCLALGKNQKPSRSGLDPVRTVSSFVKDRRQMLLALSGFFFMFVNIGFGTWGRKYFSTMETNKTDQLLSLFSIAAILGSFFSGTVSEKLSLSHRKLLLSVLPVMSLFYFILPLSTPSVLPVLLPVLGFLSYLPSAHYTSLAIELAPESLTASAASSQNLFLQLGALAMSPATCMILSFSGYNAVWVVYAMLLLVCALLALLAAIRN